MKMNVKEFVEVSRRSFPNLPNENLLELLQDEEFSNSVCEELNESLIFQDRSLIRQILTLQTESHRSDWGMSADLRLSAFLLFKLANVEDSLLIWQAKNANFDTFCGLDVQLLVGAGVNETIDYLSNLENESALAGAKHIEECRAAGDFNQINEYTDELNKYYA